MQVEFLIDKQGGTHYHLKGCEATTKVLPRLPNPYEPVKRRISSWSGFPIYPFYIIVDKKKYDRCLICTNNLRG